MKFHTSFIQFHFFIVRSLGQHGVTEGTTGNTIYNMESLLFGYEYTVKKGDTLTDIVNSNWIKQMDDVHEETWPFEKPHLLHYSSYDLANKIHEINKINDHPNRANHIEIGQVLQIPTLIEEMWMATRPREE